MSDKSEPSGAKKVTIRESVNPETGTVVPNPTEPDKPEAPSPKPKNPPKGRVSSQN